MRIILPESSNEVMEVKLKICGSLRLVVLTMGVSYTTRESQASLSVFRTLSYPPYPRRFISKLYGQGVSDFFLGISTSPHPPSGDLF